MSRYEKYLKLITEKSEREELTEAFVKKTSAQLDYYLSKKKVTQEEYDELIRLMNPNVEKE